MAGKAKLPMGIENFERMRKEGFYYVDKTGLIKKLLQNWGEVNLFTRPRRFGKSLNLRIRFWNGSRAKPDRTERRWSISAKLLKRET